MQVAAMPTRAGSAHSISRTWNSSTGEDADPVAHVATF